MTRDGCRARALWRALGGVVAGAALSAPFAAAHVSVTPSAVEVGVPAGLRLAVPNERAGQATVSLEVELPRGFAVVSAAAPAGWAEETTGRRVAWAGGRIEANKTVTFVLEVEARPPARRVELLVRQHYDDGGVVTWEPTLLVLPAPPGATPDQHLGRALVAGVVGLAVVGVTLLALGRLRRRRGPSHTARKP